MWKYCRSPPYWNWFLGLSYFVQPWCRQWCLSHHCPVGAFVWPPGLGLAAGWVRRAGKHTVPCIATRRNGPVRHVESFVGPFCPSGSFGIHVAKHIVKPLKFVYQGVLLTKFLNSFPPPPPRGFGAVRAWMWVTLSGVDILLAVLRSILHFMSTLCACRRHVDRVRDEQYYWVMPTKDWITQPIHGLVVGNLLKNPLPPFFT